MLPYDNLQSLLTCILIVTMIPPIPIIIFSPDRESDYFFPFLLYLFTKYFIEFIKIMTYRDIKKKLGDDAPKVEDLP